MIASPAEHLNEEWPLWRHDAQNTGWSASHPGPRLRLAWRVKLDGRDPAYDQQDSGPLATSDTVLVRRVTGSSSPTASTVDAFDARNGRRRWRSDDVTAMSVCERQVLLVKKDGPSIRAKPRSFHLEALDPITGTRHWDVTVSSVGTADDPGYVTTPYPIGPHGPLFVAAAHEVLLVDPTTGETVLRKPSRIAVYGDPAVMADAIIAHHVFAVEAHAIQSGLIEVDPRTLEVHDTRASGVTTPMVAGPYIVVGEAPSGGYINIYRRVSGTSYQLAWQTRGSAGGVIAPFGKRYLYFMSAAWDPATKRSQLLRAFDLASGREVWSRSQVMVSGDFVGSGDTLFVPGGPMSENARAPGGLLAVDIRTGRTRWRYLRRGLRFYQLAVAGDRLYVTGSDNYLYAFETDRPAAGRRARKPGRQSIRGGARSTRTVGSR